MPKHIIMAVFVLILALSLFWLWRSDWLAIDACLDSGGRWKKADHVCDRP